MPIPVILPPTEVFKETLDAYLYFDNFYELKSTPLWTQYLISISKAPSFDPDTDPSLAAEDPEVEAANRAAFKADFVAYAQTNGVQDIKQSELWLQFLDTIGKPANYNPTTDPLLTPVQLQALQIQFMTYVQRILFDRQTQQINLASPDEIRKREIMFRTFEILLKMLATLQDTIGAVGHNLIFYGKWQEAYTKMLTKVPTYVGGTQSISDFPDELTIDNVGTARFGYGDINFEDIAVWAANAAMSSEAVDPLRISISPNAKQAIRNAVQTLGWMNGTAGDPGGYIARATAALDSGSYLEIKTDPVSKSVSFTISGVDFTQVVNSSSPTVPLGQAFNIDNPPYHIKYEPINDVERTLTEYGNKFTISGANTWLVTKATSAAVVLSPTDLDSNVTAIKSAFVAFMNGGDASQISSLGNITGIRMPIYQDMVESGGIKYITTVSSQFSDYKLDGTNYTNLLSQNANSNGDNTAVLPTDKDRNGNTGPWIGSTDLPNSITVGYAIPWTRTFTSDSTDSDTKQRSDNASKARAEVNAKLQQYIENIRSRRQIVQDQAKQVESTLSQAKESVSQQANLLTSILDSLKSLTSAIFR